LDDVLAYKRELDADAWNALKKLVAEAQELDPGLLTCGPSFCWTPASFARHLCATC